MSITPLASAHFAAASRSLVLVNVTDHPFLIRFMTRFLSVEFRLLAREPSKTYQGTHQNKTGLSTEDISRVIGRGGPSLKEIHHDVLELKDHLRDAATLVPKYLYHQIFAESGKTFSGQRPLRVRG